MDQGSGDPVLLLHGFPDTSWLWRNQLPALVDAGYRVIAPDLRGRGQTDMPEGVDAYRMPLLVADVDGIMRALGIETAHVVGHDFGAALAWALASSLPGRVRKLAVLAVGHPDAFFRAITRSSQALRSWYFLFFQLPVAESLMSRNDFAAFRRFVRGAPDADVYVEDLSRPGALTAAINWYRANAKPWRRMQAGRVSAPTLGVWASRDVALAEPQMRDSDRYVDGEFRYERMAAGHWMMLERPEEVNRLLLEFLA